ncbi:linker for activation of T-cells family member 2 isoform X2 [Sciurus carolinensis]|uniref:linker for activation of T-cells family member 2 isoform X2 n=1 Tax=Sciurus carolinensis TaxID=30640 RepID=UPI001FB4F3F5|nr:linker for activation of T-cells family member 2 isoform X2 [Sciurus carolinensis]
MSRETRYFKVQGGSGSSVPRLCVLHSRNKEGTQATGEHPSRQCSVQETQQSFAVARTYSLVRQAWPGPRMDTTPDMAAARFDKLLRFSTPLEGSRRDSDAAYIDPIATDYYNWGHPKKSPEDDDDDANSYENVLICKPRTPESGGEETEDYQNSASIRQWRESRRAAGQGLAAGCPCPAGSPDEDAGEPDYVNGDLTAAREA